MSRRSACRCLLLAAALLALLAPPPAAQAMLIEGKVTGLKGREYLGRFCFDKTERSVAVSTTADDSEKTLITVKSLTTSGPVQLALFNDTTSYFEEILAGRLQVGCHDFLGASSAIYAQVGSDNELKMVVWNGQSPHFWFVNLVNCGADPVDVNYSIELTNPGGVFSHEFSLDRQGEFQTAILFAMVYIPIAAVASIKAFTKFRTGSLAAPFRAVVWVLNAQLFSMTLMIIHYALFSSDGVGVPALEYFADGVDRLQTIVFMVLLMFLAKGWLTAKAELRTCVLVTNLFVAILLVVAYTLTFVWEVGPGKESASVYLFESVPGVCILAIRSLMLLWFLWSCFKRLAKSYTAIAGEYYARFSMFGSLWFLSQPATVVLVAVLSPWVRRKTLIIIGMIINFLANLPLLYLLHPKRVINVFHTVQPVAKSSAINHQAKPPGSEGGSGGTVGIAMMPTHNNRGSASRFMSQPATHDYGPRTGFAAQGFGSTGDLLEEDRQRRLSQEAHLRQQEALQEQDGQFGSPSKRNLIGISPAHQPGSPTHTDEDQLPHEEVWMERELKVAEPSQPIE